MDGRSATAAAIAVAVIGIIAFFVLDGVTAGVVVFVAGVLLVVIGVFGWQERRPTLATAGAGGAGATIVAAEATPSDGGDDAGRADVGHGAMGERDGTPGRGDADDTRDELSEVPVDGERAPEPVTEEAPAPHPYVGGAEAVADPLGRGQTDSVLDTDVDPGDRPEGDAAPPEPTMQLVGGEGSLDHVHDEPLHGHSDLVTHVRDYHGEIPTDGSTIQLRLLHERAHGAPDEPPVNLRTT